MPTQRTAEAALQSAGDRLRAARTECDAARKAIEPPILEALKAGVPQKDVIKLSGLVRETVRAIARKGGIPGPEWAQGNK